MPVEQRRNQQSADLSQARRNRIKRQAQCPLLWGLPAQHVVPCSLSGVWQAAPLPAPPAGSGGAPSREAMPCCVCPVIPGIRCRLIFRVVRDAGL
jgi:hypothetical protein